METRTPLYYADYLHLDKLLDAQHPKSGDEEHPPAHDELLFIIVHQAFELWFKQVRHELTSVINALHKEKIDDNTDEMSVIVHRLYRVIKIMRLMNDQFEVLETMKPLGFLDFRDCLYPASGFQSKQFRMVEAMLGLQMENRYMSGHYKKVCIHSGGFNQGDFDEITDTENSSSVLEGVKKWLSRAPFFAREIWAHYPLQFPDKRVSDNVFISDYYHLYVRGQQQKIEEGLALQKESDASRSEHEGKAAENFCNYFLKNGSGRFTADELSAALFIQLYGYYPMLHLPFELLNSLLEIDDLLALWRYRHYTMVKKMIGTSPGTGGTAGAGYLFGAVQQNRIFSDLLVLPTFFLEKSKLPALPQPLKMMLQFYK